MEYDVLAAFYDELVGVDYGALYRYIQGIWERFEHAPKIVLDLGCGTGSLIPYLEKGRQVIGVDISSAMLSIAMQKVNASTLLLCQDMCDLDLYGTVDTIVCMLDCLNALPDVQAVAQTLQRAALFLSPGGLMVFDINTPYKYLSVLDGNTTVYDTQSVYCIWQSACDNRSSCCDFYLDFFIPDGHGLYTRKREEMRQRIYEIEQMRDMIMSSGLDLLAVYGDRTFSSPAPTDGRAYFVARKPL